MSFSKKQKLLISSVLAIALCALVVFFVTRPPRGNGVFYKVEKDGKILYLGGSVHVAKDKYRFSRAIEKAFDDSTVLVTEIIMSDVSKSSFTFNITFSKTKLRLYLPEKDNLFNYLSKENETKIQELVKELRIYTFDFDNFKPWVAGSIINGTQIATVGIDSTKGIDVYFDNKALKNHKKRIELESEQSQFDLLNSFTYEEQEKYFIDTLKSTKESIEYTTKLIDSVIKGDIDYLVNAFQNDPSNPNYMDKNDNFYKKLILERNINMANKIDELIKNDEKYFVVVGAAHVVGDDSLVNLLTQKGYKVERFN